MDDWTHSNCKNAHKWANMTLAKILREVDRDDDEDRLDEEQLDTVKDCLSIIEKSMKIEGMMHQHGTAATTAPVMR